MINFLCCASTLNFSTLMAFLNKMWTFQSKEEKQKEIISVWAALYQSLLVFLTYSKINKLIILGFFWACWINLGTLYDCKLGFTRNFRIRIISIFMKKRNCYRTVYLQKIFHNAWPWSVSCLFQKYRLM